VSEPNESSNTRRSRRALLKSAGVAAVLLAGCGERSPPDPEQPTPQPTTDPADRPTGSPDDGTRTTTEPGTERTTDDDGAGAMGAEYVYAGSDQLESVSRRVRDGEDPWDSAYSRLMTDAERALNMAPRSVVDDGAPGWENPNRFGADEDRHDFQVAMDMTTVVRDAALAYRFTGEDRYAEAAIDHLDHWCLDPETRMVPNANIADNGTSIELLVTVPKLWYGASLVGGHPYWTDGGDRDREAAFREWVRTFVASLPDPGYYQSNNQWAWRIATIASAGSYLGDGAMLDRAFCMWRGECETAAHGKDKPRPWVQYRKRGEGRGCLKQELKREDGLSYHTYGVKALTMTAEIARHHGVDLYGYNAPTDPGDGSTLKKLFDFMAPYLQSPSEWEWGTGSNGIDSTQKENYASLFELAYSRWEEEAYREVVGTVGRPAYDLWILGWTTLTHGNLFEL
jgi:hypothetical protein